MKILTNGQIKELDRYTIENEPISSIDLMERAAEEIAGWIKINIDRNVPLLFIIGKGNNGGDGLAVARILSSIGYDCSVFLAFGQNEMTDECAVNLKNLFFDILDIPKLENINEIDEDVIIIDALLGAGVSGELKEPARSLISQINRLKNKVISIDLPSGMKTGFGNREQDIVKANITLTLEFPKLALLLPEAGECAGKIVILPIGLDKNFIEQTDTEYFYADDALIQSMLKNRSKFGHKNSYGHALLICGSKTMTGAAILATGACLRSGCGLVSVHIPQEERLALQIVCPSAILSLDKAEFFSELPQNLQKYSAIGIGCGLGTEPETVAALENLLKSAPSPLVIDADALNIIAANRNLLELIPKNSILTPHLGELKRLVGEWLDEEDKFKRIAELSRKLQVVLVVKGAHTAVHLPDGQVYFNSTGDAGMAKGGSGDLLAGLITGLLARGYNSFEAAVLGVYFHGNAGDKVQFERGAESMNSSDILKELGCFSITYDRLAGFV